MLPEDAYGTIDFAMPDFGFEQPDAEVIAPPSPILADRINTMPSAQVVVPQVLPPRGPRDLALGRAPTSQRLVAIA